MRNFFKNRIPHLFMGFFFAYVLLACDYADKGIVPKADSQENHPSAETVSIDSLNQLATEHWKKGDYKKALDLTNKAYQAAEKAGDEKNLATILNTLGLIYWRLENNKSAMDSYKESAKLAEKLGMSRLLGLSHTNQGLILKAQGEYEKAFFHNNKAIQIFKKEKFYRDLAIAQNNQGQIFKNKDMVDSARFYYLKALDNYRKEDYKNGMAATYYNLSEIYMRQGLEESSLEAAYKSLDLALETGSEVRISEAYARLSETHEHFLQPDSALKYYKLHGIRQKEILLDQQSENLAKYQAKMGAALQELKIENLKKEKELVANKFWFFLIGIGVFLLFGAFFIYRYLTRIRFKKRKLEMELQNSQKIIDVREKELKSYMLDLSEKNQLIQKLQKSIPRTLEKEPGEDVDGLLKLKILTNEDWNTFKEKFKIIYPGFFTRMRQFQTVLTESEIRFMVLFRLDLPATEMAKILGVSPQSVRVCKMRLKKKLKKEGFSSVEDFLQVLVI